MAVTVASLRARRPEFTEVADGVVQGAIDDAVTEVDDRVFGDKTDQAVSLLAAHKLGLSAFGAPSRLDPKLVQGTAHGTTTHGCEYDALVAQCGGGFWVVGVSL